MTDFPKKRTRRGVLLGLSAAALGPIATPASWIVSMWPTLSHAAPVPLDLVFDANWRGDRIGTHEIKVKPLDSGAAWRTEVLIDMTVNLGLFGKITFRHECIENWRNGRLVELTSKTEDDGSVFSVAGKAKGDKFSMEGPGGLKLAPSNLLTTSSAWSVEVCRQEQLIDVTHGDIIGVVANRKEPARVDTKGRTQAVQYYSVMSPLIAGDLVYDRNGIWLGGRLERSGASIDYALKSK